MNRSQMTGRKPKPKVLHVLSAAEPADRLANLNQLVNSRLTVDFEFAIAPIAKARTVMHEWKPDIAIVHDPSDWHLFWWLVAVRGRARVALFDTYYTLAFEKLNVASKFRFRSMLRLIHWLCDRVLVVSQAQARWMVDNHLVRRQKVTLLPQCIDPEDLLRVPVKLARRPLTLAAYGQFSRQNGFDILVRAMRLVRDADAQLYLGGDGDDVELLKELAKGKSNIKFFSPVDDVPSFLAACDVVIVPSRWEPWGNTCVEAKAAGKPAIASRVDGLMEQVRNCGVLVPPEDPKALARVIEQVVAMPPDQLRALGENGRNSVRGAWDKYLMQWETVLWQLAMS